MVGARNRDAAKESGIVSDIDLTIHESIILKHAERKIQRIMLDLDEQLIDVGARVDSVDVDTRNFANMKTEIHTIKKMQK